MPFVIILTVLLCLVALVLFLVFPALRRHPDRKLMQNAYIAHRGLHSVYEDTPENSIPAFKKAIEHGLAIETDIHITADGEVVIFHDDTLNRMCGVDGVIEEKTLAELKALRLANTEHTIPTFEEFLKLVNGRVPLLIEFKTKSFKTCTPLCQKADKLLSNYNGKYFVQSFFPFVARWYKKNRKDICRGQLSSGYFEDKGIHMKALSFLLFNFLARPDFVAYEYTHEKNFFRRLCVFLGAHSAGWTFRSQDEVDRLESKFSTKIFEGFIPKK